MKTGRKTGRILARMGVCLVLLGWAFHGIFMNEARLAWEAGGGRWEALDRWGRWRLAWSEGPGALWGVMTLIGPWEGFLSVVFMGLTLLLGAWRWHLVLRARHVEARPVRSFEISFVAHFFNALLLGSTGGDLMKAYYAAGDNPGHKAEAVVSVIVDRLVGLLSMLVFAALMMLPNLGLLVRNPGLGAVALVVLAMLAGLLLVAGLSFQSGVSRIWPGARDWLRRLPKGATLERGIEAMRSLGQQRGLLTRAFGLSMLLNLACVLQFWVLARGLGLEIRPVHLLVLVPMIICVAALPITPNGLGVRENLYVMALTVPQIQVPAAAALTLSLLAYAGSLFWSLVGGVVYIRIRREISRTAAPDRSA